MGAMPETNPVLPVLPSLGRVAFREWLSLEPGTSPTLLLAPGSEPTPQHCPSICCSFLAGPVGHISPDKPEAAGQVGGQGIAESSGPRV